MVIVILPLVWMGLYSSQAHSPQSIMGNIFLNWTAQFKAVGTVFVVIIKHWWIFIANMECSLNVPARFSMLWTNVTMLVELLFKVTKCLIMFWKCKHKNKHLFGRSSNIFKILYCARLTENCHCSCMPLLSFWLDCFYCSFVSRFI